ncbi:hypothetical protein JCM10908_005151 [Rhodotorula pacifica]|uniref:NIPSNAP family protein n=1 Tax=Rhodotorula pacifica TaxID=1495444 RepID=UPI003180F0A1
MRGSTAMLAPLRNATARITPRSITSSLAAAVPASSSSSSSSSSPTSSSLLLPSTRLHNASTALGTTKRSFGSSVIPHAVRDYASAFLHGSEELKEEARVQHSRAVGRDKYVYEFQRHKVLPQHAVQYQQLIEDYYKGIHESPDFDARLIGSWEIVVGEVDTFVHIFGYEGIAGFEKTKNEIRASKGHLQFFNKEILPLIQSRTSQINNEFRFWNCSPAEAKGGIYELRTYDLYPGSLLEWEQHWRVGLEARVATGHYPIGAWFSQIGHLHQVHHMWQYDDLEARKARRAQSWEKEQWSSTVARTAKLCASMNSQILKPLPFSPLR